MPYKFSRALLSLAAFGIATWNPVNDTINRLLLIGGVLGIWLGVLEMAWPRPRCRWLWLGLPLFLLALGFLPGNAPRYEVRAAYVERLHRFIDTPYHWGGESARGIDCSGLPRRALREAMLIEGVKHGDGALVRTAISQWWFDASAQDLGNGTRDLTMPLGVKGRIAELDTVDLQPGDLAVTHGGVHLIVYLGGDLWIQADPGQSNVTSERGKDGANPWFQKHVSLHRWRALDSTP